MLLGGGGRGAGEPPGYPDAGGRNQDGHPRRTPEYSQVTKPGLDAL